MRATPNHLTCVLVGITVPAAALFADTRYVEDDALPLGNGQTWATAYQSLQDALLEAAINTNITEIRVAGGVYRPDELGGVGSGVRTATFALVDDVAVVGGFRGHELAGDPDERDPNTFLTTLSGDLLDNDVPQLPATLLDNSYHVVTADQVGSGAVLDGVTVAAGQASGTAPNDSGGGLLCTDASPTLQHCRFDRNTALNDGGAVHSTESTSTFDDCVFTRNSAGDDGGACLSSGGATSWTGCAFGDPNDPNQANTAGGGGGAIFNVSATGGAILHTVFASNQANYRGEVFQSDSATALRGCRFIGNTAPFDGGALRLVTSDSLSTPVVILNRCTFRMNHADQDGGALRADNVDPNSSDFDWLAANCIFEGNTAHQGGAIFDQSRGVQMVNCVLTDNAATGVGGGMTLLSGGPWRIANCTFISNTSDSVGGGVALFGLQISIDNSIFWLNEDPSGTSSDAQILDLVAEETVSYCDVQGGYAGDGNINADPQFVDRNNGDFRLSRGSPCIDAADTCRLPEDTADLDDDGDMGELTPIDLSGEARVQDDPNSMDTGNPPLRVADMGANEYVVEPLVHPCPGDTDGDSDVDLTDLAYVLAYFDQCICDNPDVVQADFNVSSCVDLTDLAILLGHFEESCD